MKKLQPNWLESRFRIYSISMMASLVMLAGFATLFDNDVSPFTATLILVILLATALLIFLTAWFGIVRTCLVLVILITVTLPDLLMNSLGHSQVPGIIALFGVSVVLFVFGRFERSLYLSDLAILLIGVAASIPLLVSGKYLSIPGILIASAGIYAAVRFSQARSELVTSLLLASGTVIALIAVAQQVDPLSSLIPFTPLRDGSVFYTSRSVGIYNNPNTLGNILAITIVASAAVGVNKIRGLAILICSLGIITSQSREAVAGLAIGLLFLYGRRPVHFFLGGLVGLVGYVASYIFVDGFSDRLNPLAISTDSNLLHRLEQWQAIFQHIPDSPLFGFGRDLPVPFVDNAYLGWLISGGVVSAVFWGIGLLAMFAGTRFWSVLIASLAIAMFSNPFAFASPSFSALLILAGTLTITNRQATRQDSKEEGRGRLLSAVYSSSPPARRGRPRAKSSEPTRTQSMPFV